MKWFIKCLKHYADFSGRAQRKEYWMFVLFNIIFAFAWLLLISALSAGFGEQVQSSAIGFAFFSYILALLIPSLAVSVRRLHDIGRSGWWLLLALIPYIGWLVLFIFFVINSELSSNKYGDNPKEMENNANSMTELFSTPVVAKQNVYQTTNNNPDYLTSENIMDNDLSDTNVSDVSKGNKLVCPRCGSENIKLPGELYYYIRNSATAKMFFGLLQSAMDYNVKFKCMNCEYKW